MPLPLFRKLRLRLLAVLLGTATAVVATLSLTAWPALPVVGVAVLTAAALVNTLTSRLATPICASCGESLAGQPKGVYGAICPSCGAVNQHVPHEPGQRRA